MNKSASKVMGGRRSARRKGPIEGAEGESESGSESEDIFGIGDDDDEGPLVLDTDDPLGSSRRRN